MATPPRLALPPGHAPAQACFILLGALNPTMNLWKLLRLAGRIPRPAYANPYYDPARPHHLPGGFRNNHPLRPPSGEDLMRLRREARAWDTRPESGLDLSPVGPDLDYLHRNRSETSLTWIGHATVLLQVGGLNVITDPMFSERASPVSFAGPKRHQRPGIALEDLPRIDLVLISHGHYDHLDLRSVRRLARQRGGPPHFAVPLGMERWIRRNIPGAQATALDWWQADERNGPRLQLAPVHHWTARTPWDRNRDLWGAWIVEREGFRFFFSGDVAWSDDIAEIGRRCGPFDLAAIAIGHYEPRWFMRHNHVNPEEAVRIHREIGAKLSVAIHWGTFERLTAEPLDRPVRDLAAALASQGVSRDEFLVLRHGETRRTGGAGKVD